MIMDIEMPIMNGYKASEEIRSAADMDIKYSYFRNDGTHCGRCNGEMLSKWNERLHFETISN